MSALQSLTDATMKTFLSKSLEKYYTRKGNRVVFINGDSLNELALKLWENLNFREIDASAVSRVINGERLFTPKQLRAFSHILGLNRYHHQFLQEALATDILSRSGLKLEASRSKIQRNPILELTLQNSGHLIESVRTLRLLGSPQKAIETASFLEQIAQILHSQYPSDWKKQRETFTHLYNERERAWGEIASPSKILSLMKPDIEHALAFGERTRNQQILSMAHMNLGGAYYVSRNWAKSAQYLEMAFDNVDEDTQLEFYRTIVLDYALLGKPDKFQKIQRRALKQITEGKYSDIFNAVSLLEATGRGYAMLDFPNESLSALDEAEKLYRKAAKQYGERPFFESQLIRGKLFSIVKSPKIDKDHIRTLAKRGFEPRFDTYKRHRRQINQILNKLKISTYDLQPYRTHS